MTPETFKKIRKKYKLTHEQFAQVLFVSERMVFYIESGQRSVSKRMQNMVNELNEKVVKKRLTV